MRKMPSPLYNAMGGGQQSPMMKDFRRFMQQMRGRDPNQMIDELVRSGRVSQQQLDQVQQQAQHTQGVLDSMRGMFGF